MCKGLYDKIENFVREVENIKKNQMETMNKNVIIEKIYEQ